jgi:glutathione S-transferase
MAYQLLGRHQSGSMAIEAALTLCSADWTLVDTPRPRTEADREALFAINPRGQVPVLIHPDGTVITEGPAIMAHLADAFPKAGLAPKPGTTARATQDRWIAFFHANVYEAMLRELAPARYTDRPDSAPEIASAATAYVHRHFLIFEAEAAHMPAGNPPSTLDIYLWMLCFWVDRDWLAAQCPAINATWLRHRQHPVLAPIEAAHFG